MDIKEAIAFGQYSGHESPQRILADKVIELDRENAKWKAENDKLADQIDDLNEERQNWRISYVARELDSENKRLTESLKSVRELCTTEHESKERFIARVLLCLPNV